MRFCFNWSWLGWKVWYYKRNYSWSVCDYIDCNWSWKNFGINSIANCLWESRHYKAKHSSRSRTKCIITGDLLISKKTELKNLSYRPEEVRYLRWLKYNWKLISRTAINVLKERAVAKITEQALEKGLQARQPCRM